MTKRQATGTKIYSALRAASIAGGPQTFATAMACTAAINVLALTGPAYMLLLYGRVVPSGDRTELLVVTLAMLVMYGLCAWAEITRQKLVRRSALRLYRALKAAAKRRLSPAPVRDLGAIGSFLSGPTPASLCDVPWIPLYIGALLWLHPMLCALAVAGSASVAASILLANARSEKSGSTDDYRMLAAGMLRALRQALPSTIVGLGAYLVMSGTCHPGSAFAAAIILQRMLGPVEAIFTHWRSLTDALDSARRLLPLLSAPERLAAPRTPSPSDCADRREVKIILRRSGDYARSTSRSGAMSAASGLRPTAE